MKTLIHRLIVILCCHLIAYSPCFAQSSSYLGVQKFKKGNGAEYVSGNQPGTVLMKVNLWGAVGLPGIHHVPVKTDLMSLISYAGGPGRDALLDEVTIKREVGNTRKLIKVDVEELVQGVSHHQVALAPNDIVVIPQEESLFDQDALTAVTIISLLISSVLSVTLIEANRD